MKMKFVQSLLGYKYSDETITVEIKCSQGPPYVLLKALATNSLLSWLLSV